MTTSSEITDDEFAGLTAEFVAAEIELYRRARASRQKNSARNLKKYFDQPEIAIIEEDAGRTAAIGLARTLL